MEVGILARFSLRRYDTQATLAMWCSLAAVVPLLALVMFIFQHLSWDEWIVYYGPTRQIAILGATGVTLGLAAIGFGLGYNSAGQRRNDKPQRSWIGFFVGALVASLAIALFLFFWIRGEPVTV